MNQKIANYTVIIEKQRRLGTNKSCYSALVPSLGIAVDEDDLEKLEKAVKNVIEFHLKSLQEENEPIPVESSKTFVTRSEVVIPFGATLAT